MLSIYNSHLHTATTIVLSGWGIPPAWYSPFFRNSRLVVLSHYDPCTLAEATEFTDGLAPYLHRNHTQIIGVSMGATWLSWQESLLQEYPCTVIGVRSSYPGPMIQRLLKHIDINEHRCLHLFYKSCVLDPAIAQALYQALSKTPFDLVTLKSGLKYLEKTPCNLESLATYCRRWYQGKEDAIAPYNELTPSVQKQVTCVQNAGHLWDLSLLDTPHT